MQPNTLENPKEFWKAVLGEIELQLSPNSVVFKSLLGRAGIEKITDNIIYLSCEDEFVKKNIETKHRSLLTEVVSNLARKEMEIQVSVKKQNTKQVFKSTEYTAPLFQQDKDSNQLIKEKQMRSNLSPKFTFENYVMGKNNNLAYAIATAVAEKPGELYNPVFIYSGVGLGKTHLLQAIGNQILRNKPGTKVIYTTGETFTNELIEAIQSGKGKGKFATYEFRNKFRKADVFLIDDIQFVIGKESTQEEFFHTFNALYMDQKQIVITSDRPPRDFTNLEERITSRFASGIIADIQPPDMEMRVAILRTLRDRDNSQIPNEVIDYISEKISTNVRELEGAYIQVLTYAKAQGLPLTVETAAASLGQSVREKLLKNVNMNEVLKAVCVYYSVKASDIKGERRHKELVVPRQIAMYLMKEMTRTPFMSIGEFLGGRDHTTIMHGVEKISEDIKKQEKTKQDIVNIKQLIYAN
ncbi:MAG TPA: chromosomal replication initiator protein DnaA [bacterium]|nr:chromosomal replication initiator protein DnaA [bacterium]